MGSIYKFDGSMHRMASLQMASLAYALSIMFSAANRHLSITVHKTIFWIIFIDEIFLMCMAFLLFQ